MRFVSPVRGRPAWALDAVLVILALASGVAAPSSAAAQVPLFSALGGPEGFGTDCLGPNDDGSSRAIDLRSIFPSGVQFFDMVHTTMYVNTNGNITFSNPVPNYTPAAFPIANRPMIAPYWADVDIRPSNATCGGYADGGSGYAGDCMSPRDNGVWWALDTANRRVVVTWDNVGYYRCHTNHVMAFQLVLTAVDGGCAVGSDFDVDFRFNTCEWNCGDASGGLDGLVRTEACVARNVCPFGPTIGPNRFRCSGAGFGTCSGIGAQSGFDAGNLMDFVEIMGSRTADVHTMLCTGSNVGTPGLWHFEIRSGGVICPDAGADCTVPGTMGACAMGRTNCVGAGIECVQQVFPEAERCDNADNDCNGVVDDGTDLAMCGAGFVCQAGACVENCFESACATGLVCNAGGLCVEAGCETISCPAGERCSGGACVPPCDGVTCPYGQVCQDNRCIDPCAGLTCDACSVCDLGTCVPRCTLGAACGAGTECDGTAGLCVPTGCAGVSCPAGQYCDAGSCVDACTGVSCPVGTACMGGTCNPIGIDAGPPPVDAGPVVMTDAGPGLDAGTGFDARWISEIDTGPTRTVPRSDGCSCSAPARRVPASAGSALLVLGLVGVALRRRRRA